MSILYKALNAENREIRLLRLATLPEEGSTTQPGILDFELNIFPLDEQPDFVALSYCWGDEPATRTIRVNETDFLVRPNLHSWLKIMYKERHDYWIFIDAICINQADVQERSSQVAIMGDVYRDAAAVVAWLGDHQDPPSPIDDPDWQHSFNRYAALVTCEAIQSCIRGLHPRAIGKMHRLPKVDTLLLSTAYLCIAKAPYWARAWIVQELLLARSLTIRQGELDVPWRAFSAILDHLFPNGFQGTNFDLFISPPLLDESSLVDGILRISSLLREVQLHRNEARLRQLPLPRIVIANFLQKCSVPHDKVYSLLGMTTALVQPDYDCELRDVYVRAMIEGLRSIQSEAVNDARRFITVATYYTVALARATELDLYRPLEYSATAKVLELFPDTFWVLRGVMLYWPTFSVKLTGTAVLRPSLRLVARLSNGIANLRLQAARTVAKANYLLGAAMKLRTSQLQREAKCPFARLEDATQAVISDQQQNLTFSARPPTMTVDEAISCGAGILGLRSDSQAIRIGNEAILVINAEFEKLIAQGSYSAAEANLDLLLQKYKLCSAGESVLHRLWNRGLSSRRNLEDLRAWTSRRQSIEEEIRSQNGEVSGSAWCGVDTELAVYMRGGEERAEKGDAVICNDHLMDAFGSVRDGRDRIPPPNRLQKWLP